MSEHHREYLQRLAVHNTEFHPRGENRCRQVETMARDTAQPQPEQTLPCVLRNNIDPEQRRNH